jgi:hypothetical protein
MYVRIHIRYLCNMVFSGCSRIYVCMYFMYACFSLDAKDINTLETYRHTRRFDSERSDMPFTCIASRAQAAV